MSHRFKFAIAGILLTLASALFANSPQKVVQTLEQVLRRDITNPKDSNGLYLRIVPASPEETAKGKLQLVEIESKPARIKNIFLRELRARAVEPVIDVAALSERGKLRTISVKESNLEGVMDAENFERMLAELKATKDMRIKVQITDDSKVVLRGVLTLLRINNPFEAVCRPEARDGCLYLKIEELRVNGVGAPAFLVSRLEKHINPVVEPKDLPFNSPIKSVRIHKGLIYVNMPPAN
ncbi:MAG: LmeA family phospholipid-binding protein [Armatimonadota bacterium]|nr:DUF2993 domain-containing protein [Armatimonadota bacterium]MDW8144378.1 LmeA family phospholipid-binding protein [Armatimonadota bacterium]